MAESSAEEQQLVELVKGLKGDEADENPKFWNNFDKLRAEHFKVTCGATGRFEGGLPQAVIKELNSKLARLLIEACFETQEKGTEKKPAKLVESAKYKTYRKLREERFPWCGENMNQTNQ